MKKLIWMVLLVPVMANADLSIKQYLEMRDSNNPEISNRLNYLIDGLGYGIYWSHARAKVYHDIDLYCPPMNLSLGWKNYVSILAKEFERDKAYYLSIQEVGIGNILLEGMVNTFPCETDQ